MDKFARISESDAVFAVEIESWRVGHGERGGPSRPGWHVNKIRHSSINETRVKLAKLARTAGRLIALAGSLALLISIASPADDAVQHELAPSRSRQVLRLSRAHHPVTSLLRRIATKTRIVLSLPVSCWNPAPKQNFLFSDEIQLRPTGDRSPPHSL